MTDGDDKTAGAGTAAATAAGPRWGALARLSLGRYAGALIGLVLVCVYMSFESSAFATWDNVTNIIKANSVVLLLGIGATFVILTAGIDLSAASATAACAMILGLTMKAGWGPVPVIVITLLFGVFLGLINGVLIGKAGISFFVVTLGTLSIYASFALVVNDGATINVFGFDSFQPLKDLVNNDIGPIPVLVVVDLALLLLAGGVLRYTRYGRAIYAVGSNPEAARLTGVRVAAMLVSVYAIAGLAAGLASLVQVGRLTGASPTVDPTLLLTVLAAVLIGGTSYQGGEGGVFGTLLGVMFLGVVQNGLTLLEVSAFWQGTVSGGILIIAVGLGVLREKGFRLRVARERRRSRGGTGAGGAEAEPVSAPAGDPAGER